MEYLHRPRPHTTFAEYPLSVARDIDNEPLHLPVRRASGDNHDFEDADHGLGTRRQLGFMDYSQPTIPRHISGGYPIISIPRDLCINCQPLRRPFSLPPLNHFVSAEDAVRRPKPQPRHYYQYSKCTGRKRALCIGINYVGQRQELQGCVNDARHVHDFLLRHHGFRNRDIMILTDTDPNPRRHPTKAIILGAMQWLVEDAQCHDSLFLHFSGHGGRTPDLNGDELSGFDETIYPVDYMKSGTIVDDFMHDLLVKPLPMGCRLTALFDCCHSGTILDLPFAYNPDGTLLPQTLTQKAIEMKKTSADVICWSGSEDGQTCADTFQGGVAVGAMSYAFITSLKKNKCQSYQGLLNSLREILRPRFSQTPQLGSSHRIDTGLRFVI